MSHICSLLAIGQLEPPISEDVHVSAWTHNYSTHSFTVPTSEPYRKLKSKSHQVPFKVPPGSFIADSGTYFYYVFLTSFLKKKKRELVSTAARTYRLLFEGEFG